MIWASMGLIWPLELMMGRRKRRREGEADWRAKKDGGEEKIVTEGEGKRIEEDRGDERAFREKEGEGRLRRTGQRRM